MDYLAIGLMSGSSLDGLDIVLSRFGNEDDMWSFDILEADCFSFDDSMREKLAHADSLDARSYMLLDSEFGYFSGACVNRFLKEKRVRDKIDVIGSHGHTTFHLPEQGMTHQLGNGAAIAAVTGIPVVSDLRSLDVALGGQGAPIVPIGERLLFTDYSLFLNIGGIANIAIHKDGKVIGFDVCPANRVLNMLAADAGKSYDDQGKMAATGKLDSELLEELNRLDFYSRSYPKSLANSFGIDTVYPIIKKSGIDTQDALATYCEHIGCQVAASIAGFDLSGKHMLITGGGAYNDYLVSRIAAQLEKKGIETDIPVPDIVAYKEALIMALIGVLRLQGKDNTLSSVTGARKSSCGGALWI